MVIKKIELTLRNQAKLGPWQVISPGNMTSVGHVEFVKDLKDVQFKVYEKNTVLLTQVVGGNEEIPVNVVGLVIVNSRDYPDILAHVSVRSRNLGVLFSVCFDDRVCSELLDQQGKWIELKVVKSDLLEVKYVINS
jgi:alpha-glucan,water dikinase